MTALSPTVEYKNDNVKWEGCHWWYWKDRQVFWMSLAVEGNRLNYNLSVGLEFFSWKIKIAAPCVLKLKILRYLEFKELLRISYTAGSDCDEIRKATRNISRHQWIV